MTQFKKALREGAVLHGEKYVYTIVRPEQQDGFGITYLATGVPVDLPAGEQPEPQKFIVREHFMYHCSDRRDDGKELAYDEYSESTVNDFQEVFKYATSQIKKITAGYKGLLQMLEDFEENGTYYYVTEYLDGPTLREYIAENGPASITESRMLLGSIFIGVRRFHARHILHTGLSPDAIIIQRRPDGSLRPVLTQLYSCKIFRAGNDGRLQLPPLACPDCYAPREQYGELDKFLPQTNVYSLGAILVFVLTGQEPPVSEEIDENMIMEMLPDTLPETFRRSIVKSMSADYHDRFDSVTLFNNALLESLVKSEEKKREEARNDPHRRRQRHWRTIAGVAVVVILLAALIIALRIAVE